MNNREAITLLRNLEDSLDSYCELNEEGKTAFCMAIEALNCSEFPNNSDTISRQAATEHLKKRLYETELNSTAEHPYYEEIADNRVDIWMNKVPSVQPEPSQVARDIATIIENEKDMRVIAQPEPEITDEQAIKHLQSSGWMQNHDKQMYEMGAKEQPQRTGRWEIYVISMLDGEGCKCSECGFEGVPYWDFCPNCGADMRTPVETARDIVHEAIDNSVWADSVDTAKMHTVVDDKYAEMTEGEGCQST